MKYTHCLEHKPHVHNVITEFPFLTARIIQLFHYQRYSQNLITKGLLTPAVNICLSSPDDQWTVESSVHTSKLSSVTTLHTIRNRVVKFNEKPVLKY